MKQLIEQIAELYIHAYIIYIYLFIQVEMG